MLSMPKTLGFPLDDSSIYGKHTAFLNGRIINVPMLKNSLINDTFFCPSYKYSIDEKIYLKLILQAIVLILETDKAIYFEGPYSYSYTLSDIANMFPNLKMKVLSNGLRINGTDINFMKVNCYDNSTFSGALYLPEKINTSGIYQLVNFPTAKMFCRTIVEDHETIMEQLLERYNVIEGAIVTEVHEDNHLQFVSNQDVTLFDPDKESVIIRYF